MGLAAISTTLIAEARKSSISNGHSLRTITSPQVGVIRPQTELHCRTLFGSTRESERVLGSLDNIDLAQGSRRKKLLDLSKIGHKFQEIQDTTFQPYYRKVIT